MHQYLKLDEQYYQLIDNATESHRCNNCDYNIKDECILNSVKYITKDTHLQIFTTCFIVKNYRKITEPINLIKAKTSDTLHLMMARKR